MRQEPGVCFVEIVKYLVIQKQITLENCCFYVLTSYYSAHRAKSRSHFFLQNLLATSFGHFFAGFFA